MNQSDTNIFPKDNSGERILLMLLPFWTPLMPPLGISCLKGYLGGHGYNVKTVDANLELKLWEIHHSYFGILKGFLPETKRGNFYNTGHDVLRNHLMAYFNHEEKCDYVELVKMLVLKHYFTEITDSQVNLLEEVVKTFYAGLEEYLLHLLEREKPSIAGISVFTGTFAPSMFAFKLIKERFPHIKTVMGGGIFANQLCIGSPNYDAFMDRFSKYIDKIIAGEGELLFLKMLKGELPESKKVYTLEDIDWDTFDISRADIPDFSDLDVMKYPQMTSYASRSCPFQCTFCSETVQWGAYRKKDSKQIVSELEKLYKKYGYQLFLFGDSLLNPVITQLSQELIESGSSLYWDGYLRADKHVCDIENTLLWRQGGFYRARLGVESGSQRILDLMDKRITPGQIKSAISALAYAGIKTTTYWVVGYPGETEEDFQQTLDIIEELKDDIYEAECNPFTYFLNGQVGSDKFASQYSVESLYPKKAADMLVTSTWVLDSSPSREEIYERVCRFAAHCRKMGLPNPYTMQEINDADERWRRLHKNAVPLLLDFKNRDIYINESRNVSKLLVAEKTQQDDGDFGF